MARRTRPRLGLCPIGKFVFSHADALRLKGELQAKLREWQVDFVDLDGVLPDGLALTLNEHQTAMQIAGTPTVGGTFHFTILASCVATNTAGGQMGTQSYTLVVK